MRHEDKPSTPGEALEHHGVKGMRWGHRKKEEKGDGRSSGAPDSAGSSPSATGGKPSSTAQAKELAVSNASLKRMMAASAELDRENPPSEAKLMQSKQDWLKKFEPSGAVSGSPRVQPLQVPRERKKLTPAQKKLIKGAIIGVGAVGAAYYLNRQFEKSLGIDSRLKDHLKNGTLRGKPIDAKDFNNLTTYSQLKVWTTGNHITKDSWAREAFELPVGHTFTRLSQQAEDKFSHGTYSVTNQDDWHRYLTNFRHEKGPGAQFHKVEWTLTEPVKVPALKDVVGAMQKVLEADGHPADEKSAIRAYKGISGGDWGNDRPRKLIAELKKRGYGALVDEMDAGVIGDKPLVFFAGEKTGGKTSKPLTMAEIQAAEKAVKELSKRKP